MNSTKKIYLFIFFSFFIMFGAFAVYAEELPSLKTAIQTTFNWILGIAGLLAGMSFAAGAVQYIISDHANGKERMIGSVLGLALIFGSFIILQTINPKLTSLDLQTLPAGAGIFFVKGSTKTPASMDVKDTTPIVEAGYTSLAYDCLLDPSTYTPSLLVWIYSSPNFKTPDITKFIPCNNSMPIQTGSSYKMELKIPGVYFWTKSDGYGFASHSYTKSISKIPSPFAGNIKSFEVVNPSVANLAGNIGVILHEDPRLDYGGGCQLPKVFAKSTLPQRLDVSSGLNGVQSADIFMVPDNLNTAGEGVSFFSEPFGWNKENRSGRFDVLPAEIGRGYTKSVDKIKFNWKDTGREDLYQRTYPTFKEAQGSIRIDGNYIVAIYLNRDCSGYGTGTEESGGSQEQCEKKSEYRCQTFTETVNDLGAESFNDPDYKLKEVRIFPMAPQ